jgi:hypothetical protein
MISPPRGAARPRSAWVGCLGLLLLGAAMYGVAWGYDALVGAPWAHSMGGRPTLTGRWAGPVEGGSQPGGEVRIEIERGSAAGVSRSHGFLSPHSTYRMFDYTRLGAHPTLHGTAVWCRGDGTVSRYTLSGWAARDGGVTVVFDLEAPPTRSGPELRETHGHWSGAALILSGPMRLYVVDPGHATTLRPATDTSTLNLHSGGPAALDAACTRSPHV